METKKTAVKNEGEPKYIATTDDKKKMGIYFDGSHHRAFNAAGKQIGSAWIKLSDLLKEIKAQLVPEEADPSGAAQGQPAANNTAGAKP